MYGRRLAGAGARQRYRAWLGREEWAQALAELGRRIDYNNGKDAVFRHQGASRYEKAMHEVWSALARTQPGGPYGQGGSGFPPVLEDERDARRHAPGTRQ